jgi:hypothetical protein
MLQHEHQFGEWTSDGANTHTRRCTNGNTCTATETAEHTCDAWADCGDGTHSGKCSVCGEGMTEAHSWSDWAVGVTEDTFIRSCKCGADNCGNSRLGNMDYEDIYDDSSSHLHLDRLRSLYEEV